MAGYLSRRWTRDRPCPGARGRVRDLDRVVVVGHSAGGHLALWTAARWRIASTSALYVADPVRPRGAINLAGPLDLAADIGAYEAKCGDTVITSLMGGAPVEVGSRYAEVSPFSSLPVGVRTVLVWGEHEDFVPRHLAQGFVDAAVGAGDPASLLVVPGAGHFEVADPTSSAGVHVIAAIAALAGVHRSDVRER